jgi:GT2 family glycosyltransferase
VIDSTGIYFLRNLRHLDRGEGEIGSGQYDRPEYVMGATGAAALYRRKMVEDVSVEEEFFDGDFFAYREDADVAWRAQLLG